MPTLRVGLDLPDITLATLVDGVVVGVPIRQRLYARRAVVFGMPAAFAPVCSGEHLPGIVAHADRLRACGIDDVVCVVANDAWVAHAWASSVRLSDRITLLADGNLEFASALGLTALDRPNHLGWRSCRYLLTVEKCIVRKFSVENELMQTSSTSGAAALRAVAPI